MEATGRSARVAVPAILRAFKDPDRRVRLAAACGLAQFDPSAEGVLEFLLREARRAQPRDGAPRTARPSRSATRPPGAARPGAAARTVPSQRRCPAAWSRWDPPRSRADGGAQDPTANVRRRAARRCAGSARRPAAPSALIGRLKDPVPCVRAEAALALGEVQREKAIPILKPLLRDEKRTAKAAAEALCALGQRDGLAELPQGSTP